MGRSRETERHLTERQHAVLRLLAKGYTNAEIAERLGISLAGAKWHVSDLLTRFGVDSRDELADRWANEQRAVARLRRWFIALAAGTPMKPALLAVTGAGAVAVSVGAFAVIGAAAGSGTGDEPLAVAAITGATPSPTATVVPRVTLPSAPGAIWGADEAYRRAEDFARNELDTDRNRTVTYGSLTLTRAEWLPRTTLFEGGDGDRYWESQNGTAGSNLWEFAFESTGTVTDSAGQRYDPATIFVQILLEDGIDDEPTAEQHLYSQPNGDPIGGGAGNFHSRRTDAFQAQRQLESNVVGEPVVFGWPNGDPSTGATLQAHFSEAAYWCVRGVNSDGSFTGDLLCKPHTDLQSFDVHYSRSGRAPQTGGLEDASLFANTALNIASLGIRKQGEEVRYPTYLPPPESGITRRFAWLGIGTVGLDGFEVIGYDAAGIEVWKEQSEPIGFPPPPPPTAIPTP